MQYYKGALITEASKVQNVAVIEGRARPVNQALSACDQMNDVRKKAPQPKQVTITEAFAAQVAKTPHKIVLRDENRALSYSELDKLANSVAAMLPPNPQFVGLVMDHGVEMIAAILGILKAGAAYVPAEPSFPPERIHYMMKQCGASAAITQHQYEGVFENTPTILVERGFEINEDAQSPDVEVAPDSLAYVLYTSGTTGYPKGVAVEHRNVCHYVRAFQEEFKPGVDDIMLQNSVCTFDIFVEEVFPIMLSGGMLAIPDTFTRANISTLVDFIEANEVSIISGFPYLMNDLNKIESLPSSIRLLISGGDVLRADFVTNLLDKAEVYNTYGPTETTVCASYFHCNEYEPLETGTYPVGKAVAGAVLCLLNKEAEPAEIGEVGEICICGDGVARGYLEPNVPNSGFQYTEGGRRIYRSGDLGRLLPDGNMDFLKRKDAQVMILGKRVEPQEVELVLERNEAIEHAVVLAEEDETGLSYLTAYLVTTTDDVQVSELRDFLAEHLPEYMIPEYFVVLDHLPLTPNGKIDKQSLPVVLKESALS